MLGTGVRRLAGVLLLGTALGCVESEEADMDEYRRANLANWDKRAGLHATDSTGSYRIDSVLSGRSCLHAIEVLNEPHGDVPTDLLKDYYRRANLAIRIHCPPAKA